jgi:hypothetical protein
MVFQDITNFFPSYYSSEKVFFYAYDILMVFKIHTAQDCCIQD